MRGTVGSNDSIGGFVPPLRPSNVRAHAGSPDRRIDPRFGALLRLSASTGLPFGRMVSSVLATACGRLFPPCPRYKGSAGDESRTTSDQHKPTDPRYLDNGHDAEGGKDGTGGNEQVRLSSHA